MKKTILLGGIILIVIGTLLMFYTKNNKQQSSKFNFTIDESLKINICNNKKENCQYTYLYPQIHHSNKNEELQNVLLNMNNKIKNKYNSDLNNLTKNDSSCSSVAKKYKHSKISQIDEYLYETDDYISITYKIENINFCKKKATTEKPVVYIFSKKKAKILTQKQFQKELNITNEEINNYINSSILVNNETMHKQYSLDYNNKDGKEIKLLFYDNDGNLSIYYYQSIDNSYYIANIKDVN